MCLPPPGIWSCVVYHLADSRRDHEPVSRRVRLRLPTWLAGSDLFDGHIRGIPGESLQVCRISSEHRSAGLGSGGDERVDR